jgi:hypothetical protein
VQGTECRVQGSSVKGAGCRVQGAGCRVQGSSVQGAGCRLAVYVEWRVESRVKRRVGILH